MTAEQIAERLHARRLGSGWVGHCPGDLHVHGDRNASLSISIGRSANVLLHCFAGCSVESICAALKIKISDLFSEPGVVQPKPKAVREAETKIENLRSRLTPRERKLPVTVIYCDPENVEAGIAWALALTVEGEIVQAIVEDQQ